MENDELSMDPLKRIITTGSVMSPDATSTLEARSGNYDSL